MARCAAVTATRIRSSMAFPSCCVTMCGRRSGLPRVRWRALAARQPAIDPVVAFLVAATNGLLYRHLIGQLTSYPIPDLALPPGNGRPLLDVGCSWGRWTMAAAARGYDAIG